MLDIEEIVRKVTASLVGTLPILAAPFEVSNELGLKMVRDGLIRDFVRNEAPTDSDENAPGWWIDRHTATWKILRGRGDKLLYLGAVHEIGSRMLVSAAIAGIGSIYFVSNDGVVAHRTARLLKQRFSKAIFDRTLTRRIQYGQRTYEQAFAEFFEVVGDTLRLPDDAFVSDKAVLVLGSLGPGGAERQAANTAIGIASRDKWVVSVGCNHLDSPGADFHRGSLESAGISVDQISSSLEGKDAPNLMPIVEWSMRYQHLGFQNVVHIVLCYALFLRQQKPSLVHTWMDYSNVLAGIAAEMVGIPALVMSGRSMAPDNFSIFQPYMKPGYLELFKHRTPVFTNNSQAGADDYQRWLGRDSTHIRIVQNGFKFPAAGDQPSVDRLRRHLNLSKECAVVGSIIRFSEEKQPYLWVKVAQKILEDLPDTRFVVFGSGVMHREVCQWVVDQGLEDRIFLPGITEDAWTAVSIMDVFLLTSRMEGLPNVLIEAQSMGVPVVTPGYGGMGETYIEGVSGLTSASPEVNALATSVMCLLSDKKALAEYSDRASKHAREQFDVGRMVDQTVEAFADAMNNTKN